MLYKQLRTVVLFAQSFAVRFGLQVLEGLQGHATHPPSAVAHYAEPLC